MKVASPPLEVPVKLTSPPLVVVMVEVPAVLLNKKLMRLLLVMVAVPAVEVLVKPMAPSLVILAFPAVALLKKEVSPVTVVVIVAPDAVADPLNSMPPLLVMVEVP